MIFRKKFIPINLFILSFVILALLSEGQAQPPSKPSFREASTLRSLPPEPPATNPHPALTEIDKKRVKFAEQAISLVLKNKPSSLLQPKPNQPSPNFINKNLNCLQTIGCIEKDTAFTNEILTFYAQYGEVVELRHSHLIPWSIEKFNSRTETKTITPSKPLGGVAMPRPILKADEYMVHSYVKFNKAEGWYHLDIILSEDKNGELYLRHFFTTPMPAANVQLPPGVVC